MKATRAFFMLGLFSLLLKIVSGEHFFAVPNDLNSCMEIFGKQDIHNVADILSILIYWNFIFIFSYDSLIYNVI